MKIQRSIFQRDVLSPFLFVIAKITLNHILRGARGVMAIVVRNEHGDKSSNPGRG